MGLGSSLAVLAAQSVDLAQEVICTLVGDECNPSAFLLFMVLRPGCWKEVYATRFRDKINDMLKFAALYTYYSMYRPASSSRTHVFYDHLR